MSTSNGASSAYPANGSVYATPVKIGALELKNRVIFAPCTRNRGHVPGPLQAQYYAQRASAGLLIHEATMPELQGYEFSNAPGIYEPEQIEGHKLVTDAVHKAGGLIVLQVMNIGRVAHPLLQGGRLNYGPSAVRAAGGRFKQLTDCTYWDYERQQALEVKAPLSYVQPRALPDPRVVVERFRQAFKNAKEAGYDGVEVHGANGYLVHQFLDSSSNKRQDEWGGSPEKRTKFALEVVQAAIDVWGADRVGIKISPSGGYNDVGMSSEETLATYAHLLQELAKLRIAYVHIQRWFHLFDPALRGTIFEAETFRQLYKKHEGAGAFLTNGDYTPAEGASALSSGESDGLVFGRPFIANPDLPRRVAEGLPLNAPDVKTLYEPGTQGYLDYKRWDEMSDEEKQEATKAFKAAEDMHAKQRGEVADLIKQQRAKEAEDKKNGHSEFEQALKPLVAGGAEADKPAAAGQ